MFLLKLWSRALTTHYDQPGLIADSVHQVTLDYLAVGIDPNKLLPSITNRSQTWFNGDEAPPLIKTDGFFVISNGRSQGKVTSEDADGTRFVNYDRVYQYPLYVYQNGGKTPNLTLRLHKPHTKMSARKEGNGVIFDLVTSVKGIIVEDHSPHRSPHKMEEEAEKQIESEIRKTFEKTKSSQIESYGLAEHLYRHHLALWKEEVQQRADPIKRFNLGKVEVHVKILNASTYKYTE